MRLFREAWLICLLCHTRQVKSYQYLKVYTLCALAVHELASVGAGDRGKAEYLASRIRRVDPENRLLSGYEPLVRNAVSHAGSDGVVYRPVGVLFREIKRGTPPTVEAVNWSRDALVDKPARLYDCIISIDAAVNVFGVDCGDLILQDEDVKSESLQRALTREQRTKLRASQRYEGIRISRITNELSC
jgi:hypothetical protein